MDNFEEHALKIANYLENKMSPEEEEAFMLELSSDDDLRQQFEDELAISAILKNESGNKNEEADIFLQSADDHIKMIETALEKKQEGKAPVINMFMRYRNIAAIFLVVVSAAVIYLMISKKNNREISQTQTQIDTSDKSHQPIIASNDSSKKHSDSVSQKNNILAFQQTTDSIYKKFYKAYSGNNDPVEVSYYRDKYKSGKYSEVIAATDKDIQTMGADDKSKSLQNYLKLYKGLSYLNEKKFSNAIQEFNIVLQSAAKKSDLYYDAQWYSVLSLLKENDIKSASEISNKISESSSPYKNRADQLSKELSALSPAK